MAGSVPCAVCMDGGVELQDLFVPQHTLPSSSVTDLSPKNKNEGVPHDTICKRCLRETIALRRERGSLTDVCPAKFCGVELVPAELKSAGVSETEEMGSSARRAVCVVIEQEEGGVVGDGQHQEEASAGLAKLEGQGVVRRCPRCATPTEHGGGCPRMLCAVCGERWEWDSQQRWGAQREAAALTPAEARRCYEAFIHAESIDKQIALWIVALVGLTGTVGFVIRLVPDWRACLSWLALFRSGRDWIQDRFLAVGSTILHPQSPAEVTAALVVLMMMVAGVCSGIDVFRRRKAVLHTPAPRRGVRGSSGGGGDYG